MTTITADCLLRETTIGEVEAEIDEIRAPDVWLEHWCRFLGGFGPGDAIWEYCVPMPVPEAADPEDWVETCYSYGYARVHGGEVVDSISGLDL